MRRLSRSQKEITRRASAVLHERGIVFLSGQRNGKTYSLQSLLDENITAEQYAAEFPRFKRERIAMLEHVRFPRTYGITTEGMMRMILQAIGAPRHLFYGNTFTVRKAFAEEMLAATKDGTIFVLWIDNAENLPPRAYSVIKELNELRSKKTDIGIAAAMAGYHPSMKMPYWFDDLIVEIPVAPLRADEIRDIIDQLYPNERHLFSPVVIKTLEQCATTGVMRKALRMTVDDLRRGIEVDVKPIDLAKHIANWNEKVFAKAA